MRPIESISTIEDGTLVVPDNASTDIADIVCSAVHVMMQKADISVRDVNIIPDQALDKCVREIIAGWHLEIKSPEKLEMQILYAVQTAAMFYGHMETDIQCQIALYTFLVIRIDDFDTEIRALEEFSARLSTATPQLHRDLTCLAEVLSRMSEYYLPYASQSIIISTIQFVNSTAFDKNTASMALHADAVLFPEYRRIRNGIGEAYTFFAWDKFRFPDITAFVQVVPDMMLFLSYANDVFSFYKEELAGERNNYVHDRSNVTGKDTASVLLDIAEDVAMFTRRARAMLEGDARLVLEQFIQGYLYFHFVTPRYRVERFLDLGFFVNREAKLWTST